MGRPSKISKTPLADLEKELTPEQQELIQLTREGRKDPVAFAEKLLDIRLHDGQKIWLWMTTRKQLDKAYELGLKISDDNRRLWANREEFDALIAKNESFSKNILVPSNRWGKTLITSVKHLWYNYYKIGVRGQAEQIADVRCGTLNLSPHSNQCQAGYEYVMDILFSKFVYTLLEDDPENPGTQKPTSHRNKCKIEWFYVSDNSQKRTIHFKNGTFYKAIPTGEDQASSLAGNPYTYISYDECAQSNHLKAELPAKIMSRLIDFGGPLDLVSTPEVDKPSHQYFFHISKLGLKAEEGWWTFIGRITDNIFLGAKEVRQITDAIKSTDPTKYRQVAFGEFVTTGKKMFDAIVIERLWDGFTPLPVLYEHKYLVISDWGFSDTGDPTVFYVLDYTELLDTRIPEHKRMIRVAYRESIRGGSPYAVLTRAKMLQREWNGAVFLHDASSMGGVIIRKILNEMQMTNIIDFSASGDKAEMLFVLISTMSSGRKTYIDDQLRVVEDNPNFGQLRSYHIAELEEQLGNYQYNPDKGVTDKRIEQDDVMCLGMGVWYIMRKILKKPVGAVTFNPLANDLKNIFSQNSAAALKMRTITIPEKRIL